ncbi:restriction endonuclease [Aliarcobacter cryaerophilus]|uniref:restriction endonuclease n=1 Tax=Aliarcobacter cryaerophilus TaxID=28198 RepID=UPI003BAE76BF
MLDFKELSVDGNDFELLIREILLTKGYSVHWSGRGPDGGKDLICYEDRTSEFLADRKTWLIQCKHKAHGGGSISTSDLDDIIDSCNHHNAQGYLLACTTYPSSTVVSRLEGITSNTHNGIEATYWDAAKIEQVLSTPKLWKIAQTFFPISSQNSTWEIYATERPNQWVANYKGYHFHLSNRIGSEVNMHFSNIDARITDIEAINLPKKHFIRIRAVYFNDKGGEYRWYLDYMYPHKEEPQILSSHIKYTLGDEMVLDDGQFYSFDVKLRPYLEYSDHYDKDHYDYYLPYLHDYHWGGERKDDGNWITKFKEEQFFKDELTEFKKNSFDKLSNVLKELKCAKLLRAVNAEIEELHKFNRLLDWSELIKEIDLKHDKFFSVLFIFDVSSEVDFIKAVENLSQDPYVTYRLTKAYIATPNPDGTDTSKIDTDEMVFELTLSIIPHILSTSYNGRKMLNEYMDKSSLVLEDYLNA